MLFKTDSTGALWGYKFTVVPEYPVKLEQKVEEVKFKADLDLVCWILEQIDFTSASEFNKEFLTPGLMYSLAMMLFKKIDIKYKVKAL